MPLFGEALAAVQDSILQEHRLHFQPDAKVLLLLDELRRGSVGIGSVDQRVVVCSRKFTLFIRTFAPYFDVLSTCIEVHPEWVSCFWGALRLVIKVRVLSYIWLQPELIPWQMSSDYISLLEKVADMFEAIAHTTPPYQQIYEVCRRDFPRPQTMQEEQHLAALLSYIYADFVQLFLEIYQIFCRGSQGTFQVISTPGSPVNQCNQFP